MAIVRGAGIGVILAGVSIVLWGFISKASHPFLVERRQREEMKALKQEIAEEEEKVRDLHYKIAFIQSDDGIEYEARRRGAARPGEIVIQLPQSTSRQSALESKPAPPRILSWRQRILEWLPGRSPGQPSHPESSTNMPSP